MQWGSGERMSEIERECMKPEEFGIAQKGSQFPICDPIPVSAAVCCIAHNRMSLRSKMHADLVRPSSQEFHIE